MIRCKFAVILFFVIFLSSSFGSAPKIKKHILVTQKETAPDGTEYALSLGMILYKKNQDGTYIRFAPNFVRQFAISPKGEIFRMRASGVIDRFDENNKKWVKVTKK